jgi:hypothetical protein
MSQTLPPRPSLEQLQKQAKELRPQHKNLADAQHALARSYGFDTWAALKHHVLERQPSLEQYEQLAEQLAAAYATGDKQAVREINWNYGTSFPWDHDPAKMQFDHETTQRMVAHAYGFDTWQNFISSAGKAKDDPRQAPVYMASRPPFYKIDWRENRLWARGPQTLYDWETIFGVVQEYGLTKLSASGIIDSAMPALQSLTHLTHLQLESNVLTDDGMQHLAGLPQLEDLEVGGWTSVFTDQGLSVLQHLRHLKRFASYWTQGISDASLRHLAASPNLESVELLGTHAGDGVIHALAGMEELRTLKTGRGVTDEGLRLLHEIPAFKTWQGGEPVYSLMSAEAKPNHLLVDGPFTDAGLAQLQGLDGLFGLTFFRHCPNFTGSGLAALQTLPRLGFLGCQDSRCDDAAMRQIARIPHLRMLMGQGAVAGDDGWTALSQSRTLEYIWGRECPNLGSRGFRALGLLPALRGLAVSCKNIDDEALATLRYFPALRFLMPMEVTDAGFRHVGECRNLEGLWCMYCRETGDEATEHIKDLRLKHYYAGKTQITDRSLEILGRMSSLEKLEFWQCAGITDAGIAHLTQLPRLREIGLDGLPHVSAAISSLFPSGVRVNYSG